MGGKTLIPAESPISCQIKGGAGQREEEVRLKKDAFFLFKVLVYTHSHQCDCRAGGGGTCPGMAHRKSG